MTSAPVDTLIVGAGPAGLQLAHDLRQLGVNYLLLEASENVGNFFRRFPRHRTLISINKPNVGATPGNPMRFDWNSILGDADEERFVYYTPRYFPHADDYLQYLDDYAERHGIKIQHNSRVTTIDRDSDGLFRVAIENGEMLTARNVVVATGFNRQYIPEIPGIEETDSYGDMSIDPADFINKRVLVIGKGNSGFETASNLVEAAATIHICSPTPTSHSWNSHYVGHLRAVNNDFFDTYQLKAQNAVLDARIDKITKTDTGFSVDLTYTHANDHHVTYHYDRILACTGFGFDDSIFTPEAKPHSHINGRFPKMTSQYESTNVPGLYFAGSLMHSRDYRKTMSGFIHGFRYNVRNLAKFLTYRDKGVPSETTVSATPTKLTDVILGRLNESDALFLQPGYLCDAYTPREAGTLELYQDLPLDYVKEGGVGDARRLVVTLEYGPSADNPLIVERDHDMSYANVTPFLHPVIRVLDGARETDRLDLLEDLENRYSSEVYAPPIVDFIQKNLK